MRFPLLLFLLSVHALCVRVRVGNRTSTPTGSHITDEEIRGAEEKFAESLHAAQMGMFNLLENDVRIVDIFVGRV